MAVVSISRIQVRRGQKNTGSGLPQLASGEFGWAVDSQELYIGNGSVAEGAPFVGNTKMLTETDNLFEFANTYEYQSGTNMQTGSSPNNPVLRTLQDRLDDRVSIRSFGAMGDGTDQAIPLQRAIDQLYLNASNKGTSTARVELILEPGQYNITNGLKIPPFTTIRGAGAEKTIIIAGPFTAFETCNETSTPGVYASDATSTTLNQARNITISDLTISSEGATALSLVSCKDSTFENIVLKGPYALGDATNTTDNGIKMTALSTAVNTSNNKFINIKIENFMTGVRSDNDIKDNIWTNCEFDTMYKGFALGTETILGTSGMLTGPINNTITNCTFNDIYQHSIEIAAGTDNISKDNKFYSVGNAGGNALLNASSIIKFVGKRNKSEGDWFKRSEELGYNETYKNNVSYSPEVEGPTITDFSTTHQIAISQSGEYTKLFRLPADTTKAYEIEYIYKSSTVQATRTGTMTAVVDPANNTVEFDDEYTYTGNSTFSQNLKFTAQNYDENGDSLVDTIAIMMLNLTSSDNATLYYKVKTKS
jgi:hypothetical protein